MTSGGHNEKPERNAAVAAYYATHSIAECAYHFSISVATVSTILHSLGTPIRPQGTRLGPLGDARRITRLKEFARPIIVPRIPEAPKATHFRTATEMAHAANLKAAGSGGRTYTSAANRPARTIPTARKAAVPQGGSPGRQGIASAR
jgi:transposase